MMFHQKKFTGDKVPPLTKWLYGISGISRDAVDTLVSVFYLIYIQYAGVIDENPISTWLLWTHAWVHPIALAFGKP
jgi:hypothetical protein